MYKQTQNPDIIIDLDTGAFIPRGNYLWPEDESLIEPMPAPTFADYAITFMNNFGQWLEDVAHSNAYDSVMTCTSYASSSVPQFKADADAMIAWRDALWVWASNWQNGFNGQVPTAIPSWETIKAQAPQPEAHGWIVHAAGQIIGS